jgi:hypothetical protein
MRPFRLFGAVFSNSGTAATGPFGVAERLRQRRCAARLAALDMAEFHPGLGEIVAGAGERAIRIDDGLFQALPAAAQPGIDHAVLLLRLQLLKISPQAPGQPLKLFEIPLLFTTQPAVHLEHMVKRSQSALTPLPACRQTIVPERPSLPVGFPAAGCRIRNLGLTADESIC